MSRVLLQSDFREISRHFFILLSEYRETIKKNIYINIESKKETLKPFVYFYNELSSEKQNLGTSFSIILCRFCEQYPGENPYAAERCICI